MFLQLYMEVIDAIANIKDSDNLISYLYNEIDVCKHFLNQWNNYDNLTIDEKICLFDLFINLRHVNGYLIEYDECNFDKIYEQRENLDILFDI